MKHPLALADTYMARLLVVAVFLPELWQPAAVLTSCVYLVVRASAGIRQIPARKYLLVLVPGSLVLLYLAALFMVPPAQWEVVYSLAERRASLLLAPLVFVLTGEKYRSLIYAQLPFFAYACLLACLAGNADYLWHYFFNRHSLHGLSHVDYRIIMERFTGLHPTYLGIFLCFSLVLFLPDLVAGNRRALFLSALVFCCLIALMVKSAVLSMLLVAVHFMAVRWRQLFRRPGRLLAAGGIVILMFLAIPFARQRVAETLQTFADQRNGDVLSNSVSLRKVIVSTDWGMVRRYGVWGTGPANMLPMLRERYFFYSLEHQENISSYDPHSAYFTEWIRFGIAGLLVLLAVLVLYFRQAFRNRDMLFLYFLVILAVPFFTESVLSRQAGVLFFGIFGSLFYLRDQAGAGLKKAINT